MSGPAYMDFEEPPHPWDAAPKRPAKKKAKKKKPAYDPATAIPTLPERSVALTGDEVKRGVSERARAAANLKVEGFSFAEIADMLEFETPQDAKRAVESVLAAIHGPGDYETLRLIATARLEQQIKRSTAMAGADFLLVKGDDGRDIRIPNTDKLRWHQTASADIMNWAMVTGAKAPTKVEITPDEAALERITDALVSRMGHEEVLDADVIDLDVVASPREIEAPDDGRPE